MLAGSDILPASAYSAAQPLVRRNSTVAYILVDDIDAEHERVAALSPSAIAPTFEVRGGAHRGFVFAVSDGNVIELYQVDVLCDVSALAKGPLPAEAHKSSVPDVTT